MFVAAAGAALVAMVLRIVCSSEKFTGDRAAAALLIASADSFRANFLAARELDERAFGAVVTAQGLPAGTESEKAVRTAAVQGALSRAAAVPLELAGEVYGCLELARRALDFAAPNIRSDIGCAAEFCIAAIHACAYNVRINHRYMKDDDTIAAQREVLDRLLAQAEVALTDIRKAL